MALSNLFSEAIRQGLSNSIAVIRDLSALLKAAQAKETDLLQNIKIALAGDVTALGILKDIETESKKENLLFGPVLLETPGYIQRLTAFIEVEGLKNYSSGIVDFVEESLKKDSGSLLKLFAAAEEVDAVLPVLLKLIWRQEVIPCLLQQTFNDASLLLELASAASGVNKLPVGWVKVELWVSEHLKKTQFKLPGASSANDKGFFGRLRSNYQPIATHPLVLRVLREPTLFNKENNSALVEVSADEVRLKFSEWLVDSVFDGVGLLQDLPPECAFASGAFILEIARRNKVSIQSNGDLTPSGGAWTNLANRVLERIVLNSEAANNTPSAWQNQQPLIRSIINVCPEWKLPEVLLNLRSRATKRLTANFDELFQTFSKQTSNLADTQFLPNSEKFAVAALPDLRPSILIPSVSSTSPENALDNLQKSGGGWNEYIKNLRDRRKADEDLASFANSAQAIAKTTLIIRQNFEAVIVSPFVESSLIEQRIEKKAKVTNLVLSSYLDRCLANLSLDRLESEDVSQPWKAFEDQSVWKTWINKTSSASGIELLQVWANLEVWDGLRGRFFELKERDHLVSIRLYEKAREWLVADVTLTNVDEWRPRLAAIAHLGIPVSAPLFKELTERLEAIVIGGGILGQPLEPLLIATRFEIGMTAIATNTQPASAFSTYLGDLKNHRDELLRCIKVVIQSSNAWEVRAGFNILILLARLAESTGDLYVRAILYDAFKEPLLQSLIGTAVSEILFATGISELSGLPLALAAFDLTRSARESSQAIALETIINLPWVGQVAPPTTSTLIADELTKRLISQGRSVLKPFVSEGGLAAKNLVLALFQIKLDELQFAQQLTLKPYRTSHPTYVQLENLKKILRLLFCGEQLLLNEPWKADTDDEIVPWWQAQYWFNRLTQNESTSIIPDNTISPFPADLGKTLDEEKLPSSIQTTLGLDANDIIIRVQQCDEAIGVEKRGVQWLLLGQVKDEERDCIRVLRKNDSGLIAVYQIATPFCFFNWSNSYNSKAEISLLSQAAVLEAAVPDISEQFPVVRQIIVE